MVQTDNLCLSKIYVYPVKSLGAISLDQSKLDHFGLRLDRRWMLVDKDHKFITQRQVSELCFFSCYFSEDGVVVTHQKQKEFIIEIPLNTHSGNQLKVKVWGDECQSFEVDEQISEQFSSILSQKVKLVFMPEQTERQVDEEYADQGVFTSFTDGFPILMIGEESLNDLNARLEDEVPMMRFRPNLVFSGGYPFIEDEIKSFTIGKNVFEVVKPCSRCVVTTIDLETGKKNKEPLATLATYRLQNKKVLFGQNVVVRKRKEEIKIGQPLKINE